MALVGVAAYLIALFRAPVTPGRILGAAGGVYTGLALAMATWSLTALALGPRCGLAVRAVSFGAGPAVRTSLSEDRIAIVRRVPVPILIVQLGAGPGRVVRRRLVVAELVALAAQAFIGLALLSVDPPFGLAAGIGCLGAAVLKLGRFLSASAAKNAGRFADRTAGDAAASRVIAVAQRSVSEARRLIDGWEDPDLANSSSGRTAELLVLMGEGRYREAIAVAELLMQAPDLVAASRTAFELTRARALGYLVLELEQPDPADRERFLALHRELRDAPARLTSGSDLDALYYLVTDNVEWAIDEARSASRVGTVPLRRCQAYTTLALALHRAGRPVEAQKALAAARSVGPDASRIDVVARVLGREAAEGRSDAPAGRQ
jgi:kanamycin kinase